LGIAQPAMEYHCLMQSSLYQHPRQAEPLLPTLQMSKLHDDARLVTQQSIALASQAHPSTVETLRSLLREMNSYYSNRIEGQSTHPLDIAAALRTQYSTSSETARLQRLAIAHIDAEIALEGADMATCLTMAFLRQAHDTLYRNLLPTDRKLLMGSRVVPGSYRQTQVKVGTHVAPDFAAIPEFSDRYDNVYAKQTSLEFGLVVVAAAHHRATWLHPFADGNGRAIRMQTHCALFPVTNGLWSVSRGLGRRRDEYYRMLSRADAPRAGDLDGRGTLTEKGLREWCEWFVDVASDQVTFMKRMLNLDDVQQRLYALIASRSAYDHRYRIETVPALHYLFATGPASRAVFFQLTGLGERTARSALSHLLQVGLVTSESHRGPVRIALPLDALMMVFPGLYPEAETPNAT
jgi:Fic family protein